MDHEQRAGGLEARQGLASLGSRFVGPSEHSISLQESRSCGTVCEPINVFERRTAECRSADVALAAFLSARVRARASISLERDLESLKSLPSHFPSCSEELELDLFRGTRGTKKWRWHS